MRSTPDRIRHAVSFEIIAIAMVMFLGSSLFGMPPVSMGALGIASSLVATIWTYLYNLGFDHALLRLNGNSEKSWTMRVVHTVLFEITLSLVLLPVIATMLGIGLIEALVMDISLMAFFLVYTFVFNLVYDRVFPIPE
ncbi:MAG: hypothetical protein CL534_26470 [Ahrensia sp.]|nr:hypothetical protein [Ahrensia sp.]